MSPTVGGDRPVVVLLHGVGLDHTVWDAVRPLLDPSYDVRCPDLPGHGAGGPVPDDLDLRTLAELTAPEVPAGSHLVGFSLGALVGQQLAAHRPALVASLTSVSSVCRRTDAERTAVLARLDDASQDFAGSVEASLARWFADTAVPPATVEHTRAVLLANRRTDYLRCYRVFATGDAEIAAALPTITVPALAVTGADDPGSTPDMTRRLAESLPECRAEVVPGARHMLPVQEPALLARTINEFIGGRVHV